MNKLTFNQLAIEEQVNYFNQRLFNGEKLIVICADLGISYNTVRERFKRNNFVFNRNFKQYQCIENTTSCDEALIESILDKLVNKVFYATEDQLTRTAGGLVCNLSGEVVNRSFRIYDEVHKDFKKFCEISNYNQYDILSKFIVEGIAKYSVK